MDFADILKIFGFILIPIVVKAVKESKKASRKQANSYIRTTYDPNSTHEAPKTPTPRVYTTTREVPDNKHEVNPTKYNEEDYSIPEVSLESHNYNEEDHIKPEMSLESSEYIVKDRKDKYRTINFRRDKIKDVIRDSEIGTEEFNLKFNRSELVKGIVMSEILSKPKSLRR